MSDLEELEPMFMGLSYYENDILEELGVLRAPRMIPRWVSIALRASRRMKCASTREREPIRRLGEAIVACRVSAEREAAAMSIVASSKFEDVCEELIAYAESIRD